jgi:predicted nicotinamide N-methyase
MPSTQPRHRGSPPPSPAPDSPIEDFSTFLRRATVVAAPPSCPEIRLHLAADLDCLWREQEEWIGRRGLPAPYWGVPWPGGQALARYVLDNPALCRGRTVLDFGSGSGLCAIAAAMAGARLARAAEIDRYARRAIVANARLNAAEVEILDGDLLAAPPPRADVVLAGDVCYEKFLAGHLLAWLHRAADAGATVLIGDLGRAHFRRAGLVELERFAIRAPQALEREAVTMAAVWKVGRPR